MKQKLLFLFSFLLAAVCSHAATTVTVDGVVYSLSNTTATVASQSKNNALTDVIIPECIEYEGKSYYVTSITTSAFSGCTALTSISIPGSVTSIGNAAFSGCTALNNIIFEDGEETLSLGYESTGRGLFYDCPLETLHIGRSISYNTKTSSNTTTYGYSPFYNKTTIKNITFGKYFKKIPNYAFSGCSNIKSLILPDSLATLGSNAFYGCSSLQTIDIPNSATFTSIGASTFSGCTSIQEILIPKSVTSIDGSAFVNCISLKKVIISDCETEVSIGTRNTSENLFSDCPLEFIYLGRNFSYTTQSDYYNPQYTYGYSPFANQKSLSTLVIGNLVSKIGKNAFIGSSSLTTLTIPASVTSIGETAFASCSNLKSIIFSDSESETLTSCSSSMCNNCAELKELYIGHNISSANAMGSLIEKLIIGEKTTSIGNVNNLTNITEISCKTIVPPSTGPFDDKIYLSVPLHVPYTSLKDYAIAEVWQNFKYIQSFDPESHEIGNLRYNIDFESKTAKVT